MGKYFKQKQTVAFVFLILFLSGFVCYYIINESESTSKVDKKNHTSDRQEYDNPMGLIEMNRAIRTRTGESGPSYEANYQWKELEKMRNRVDSRASRMISPSKFSNGFEEIEWKERGPANVPGRTRDILIDPDDPTHNTWFVGSSGGGIWKTTNKGDSWRWLTPTISYLETNTLAMAASNHNFILAGTGEYYSKNAVTGKGIFASYDKGESWTLLESSNEFVRVFGILIDPENQNIIVIATQSGIFRSVDQGQNWTRVYSSQDEVTLDYNYVEDIKVSPKNYLIQYAYVHNVGIIKSIDGGITWNALPQQYVRSQRSEIAISPVDSKIVFVVDYYTKDGKDIPELFMSRDAGNNWEGVELKSPKEGDGVFSWLASQGWFNNEITCHPYNSSKVYVGGTVVLMIEVDMHNYSEVEKDYYVINADKNIFHITNLDNDLGSQRFSVGESQKVSVEIRFGPNKNQKAHLFRVPKGSTFDVKYEDYYYVDYISVPFEVWDVTSVPARQLMVSFRDQGRDGKFNLINPNYDDVDPLKLSLEFILVHNIDYDNTIPSKEISEKKGGFGYKEMYSVWPTLSSNLKNEPTPYPNTIIEYKLTKFKLHKSTTYTIADGYRHFSGVNNYVHVDQHGIIAIKENDYLKTFRLLLVNDGGVYSTKISTQPGERDQDFYVLGLGYNTTQFYGVDKKPGADVYIGGTQDNGTLRSKFGIETSSLAQYERVFSGDGFEVIWNAKRTNKVIITIQYGYFGLSSDSGVSFSGIERFADYTTFPFFTRLSNSDIRPDSIYTINKKGVWRSFDFGKNWAFTELKENFDSLSYRYDVEVSKANPEIVWAGAGMNGQNSLHVSTDGGVTFIKTQNSTLANGPITSLASHPHEENTAYALFSIHSHPKILLTRDLGHTWKDLSGFNANKNSDNGFPNVAVHTLFVHPNNPEIIWVGTEIGIVETLDGGLSWHLAEGFPNVNVWELKGKDEYIMIATHGRGIWTAKIEPVVLSTTSSETINTFRVYPIPTKDYLNVEIYLLKTSSIRANVINSLGQFVRQEPSQVFNAGINHTSLNLSDLPSGVYTVELFSNDKSKAFKVVVTD